MDRASALNGAQKTDFVNGDLTRGRPDATTTFIGLQLRTSLVSLGTANSQGLGDKAVTTPQVRIRSINCPDEFAARMELGQGLDVPNLGAAPISATAGQPLRGKLDRNRTSSQNGAVLRLQPVRQKLEDDFRS